MPAEPHPHPRISRHIERRAFLRSMLAGSAAAACGWVSTHLPAASARETAANSHASREAATAGRKLIVVVFGGGTRWSESIGDPEHRFVPRLWNEMAPRGTLLADVRVEGTIVHPACTASMMTGQAEYEDNDWSRPITHPSLFEVYRKARSASDTSAWAFVYASILARISESATSAYGTRFAANVVEPPTIPRSAGEETARRMRAAGMSGSVEEEMEAMRDCARLARSLSTLATGGLRSDTARDFVRRQFEAWKSRSDTTSHDAFLADSAIACMHAFAPDVLVIAFGEIDCAHYGSWSRYTEAIRRTDELTWRIWRETDTLEAYHGHTLMLVVPDHGRELDRPNGMGFIHHGDFYTGKDIDEGCRRVWLLATGAGVAEGRTSQDRVSTRAVAATGLEYLGLRAPTGSAGSALHFMRAKA